MSGWVHHCERFVFPSPWLVRCGANERWWILFGVVAGLETGKNDESIRVVGKRFHPYAMPEENGPIFHCRTRVPLPQIWHRYKNWR